MRLEDYQKVIKECPWVEEHVGLSSKTRFSHEPVSKKFIDEVLSKIEFQSFVPIVGNERNSAISTRLGPNQLNLVKKLAVRHRLEGMSTEVSFLEDKMRVGSLIKRLGEHHQQHGKPGTAIYFDSLVVKSTIFMTRAGMPKKVVDQDIVVYIMDSPDSDYTYLAESMTEEKRS